MGLDWMLHAHKAKPGHEAQYLTITRKLDALDADKSVTKHQRALLRRDLEAALEQVSVSPYAVIGAPRVGIDEAATAWFRVKVFTPAHVQVAEELKKPNHGSNNSWGDRNQAFIDHWGRPFEQVLADERGKYVVELAADQAGVAAVTGLLTGALDYRGKVIASAECLPEDLTNEAFDDHGADEAVDYADRLEDALVAVHAGDIGELRDLRAAVKWLRYWGSRGFGFTAWY